MERAVCAGQVDRHVAVAEPLDEDVHDLLERVARRASGEQSTDRLDAGDLPDSGALPGIPRTELRRHSLEMAHVEARTECDER